MRASDWDRIDEYEHDICHLLVIALTVQAVILWFVR